MWENIIPEIEQIMKRYRDFLQKKEMKQLCDRKE